MLARGLKAKMAINIVILLVVAMILINLVIVVTIQRDLIIAETTKGEMVLARLEEQALAAALWEDMGSYSAAKAKIRKILDEAGIKCALIMGKDSGRLYFGENMPAHDGDLVNYTCQAMHSGEKMMHFSGRVWAVFWKQHSHVIISIPLVKNGNTVAGASIVLSLEGIYESLRHSQKLIFIYILLNALILASAGIYRLSKVYFQPLARLANRAEDYRDDDEEFIFTVRKADNELHTLSKALNSMLKRISADKEKLRSTVQSLEQANLELKKAQEEIFKGQLNLMIQDLRSTRATIYLLDFEQFFSNDTLQYFLVRKDAFQIGHRLQDLLILLENLVPLQGSQTLQSHFENGLRLNC